MTRSIMYGLVGICLIVNIWSNVSSFQQAHLSDETGELVAHTYQILRIADAAKLKIHDLQADRSSVRDVRETLRRLSDLVGPPSRDLTSKLNGLSDADLSAQKSNAGLALLAEMTDAEQSLLTLREGNDRLSSSRSIGQSAFASVVDVVLIFVISASFIHERRSAKKMRIALASALDQVEAVNHGLQKSLINKELLIRTTVHDLKNPLGSIKGFAQLLADETAENKSVFEMTQFILRISNHTLNLVGSLLEDQGGADSKNRVSMSGLDCLKETCAFLEPIAAKKQQRLNLKEPARDFRFDGTREQIQDVFFNVIGNALKFSPPGSVISVSCVGEGRFNAVRVVDQGPGFTERDLVNLFVPGARLSAKPTGGEDSTGIGLLSVKKAVEGFKGAIEMANNESGGATATIRFPVWEFVSSNVSEI